MSEVKTNNVFKSTLNIHSKNGIYMAKFRVRECELVSSLSTELHFYQVLSW